MSSNKKRAKAIAVTGAAAMLMDLGVYALLKSEPPPIPLLVLLAAVSSLGLLIYGLLLLMRSDLPQ